MSKKLKIIIILGALTLAALGVTVFFVANNYFMDRFPEQSTVLCGTEVCGKTVSEAVVAMNSAEGVKMTVTKDGVEHVIPIQTAVTRMFDGEKVKQAKSDISFFDYLFHTPVNMDVEPDTVNIDEKKLLNVIETTLPKTKYKTSDAYFDADWNLINEVQGDDVNYDEFMKQIKEDILKGHELVYNVNDYYYHPKVKASDENMKSVQEDVQKYKKMSVTINMGKGKKEVLTSEKICSELNLKNEKLKLKTGWIKKYVRRLAKKYNTLGSTRKFKTTKDGVKKISGGTLGWWMDESKTLEKLNKAIKKRKATTIKAEYRSKGAVHGKDNDIGKSYVEVSINRQHVWVYVKGKLKMETDCVTGVPNKERMTHPGCHFIFAKQRDRWLGTMAVQGYHTHVDYFMPFNGGEGLHDAPWRGAFGGSIYRGGGSHGCVNLPPSAAAQMFGIVWEGMPVIVYD